MLCPRRQNCCTLAGGFVLWTDITEVPVSSLALEEQNLKGVLWPVSAEVLFLQFRQKGCVSVWLILTVRVSI